MIHLHLLKDKNIRLKKYLFHILKPNSKNCGNELNIRYVNTNMKK